MIVLNLLCDNGHRFEGWFASSETFHSQLERGLVQCAHCGTSTISQLPSGPRVRRGASGSAKREEMTARRDQHTAMDESDTVPAASLQMVTPQAAKELFRQLATMARQAEDVGERLPEEARRIHYREAPARNIRGVATAEETMELLEEGIMVLPAPVPPEDELH